MKTIAGWHLIVDGYVRDPRALNSPEHLVSMMDALVDALSMQYLQRPQCMRVQQDPRKLSTDADDGGWSVVCQITTSHIAIHTWPLRCAFMMDVFSCRPFDGAVAKNVVFEQLGVEEAVCTFTERKGPAR